MSPPCNLPTIPGVTEPEEQAADSKMVSLAEEGTSTGSTTPKENIAPADAKSE